MYLEDSQMIKKKKKKGGEKHNFTILERKFDSENFK